MKGLTYLICSIFVVGLTGCSYTNTKGFQYGAAGGALGAGVGAGTGAIIGSVIANGDVAASAMLGAGIGLPAGILLGATIAHYEQAREIRHTQDRIEANTAQINATEADLRDLRQDLKLEIQDMAGGVRGDYLYTGASLGRSR